MADKNEITREVVLANIDFYRDWLIKTRGFRPSSARYYVGLVTKLMEAKDPAEVFDKGMARALATFNNPHMTRAWSKKSGFLKFWEQLKVSVSGVADPELDEADAKEVLDQLFSDDDLDEFPTEIDMFDDEPSPKVAPNEWKIALQKLQAMLASQAKEDQGADEYLDGTPNELVNGIYRSVDRLKADAAYDRTKQMTASFGRQAGAYVELLGLAKAELGLNLPLLTDAEWAARSPKEIASSIQEGIKQLAKKGTLDGPAFAANGETMVKLSAVVDFLKTFEKK